MKGEKNLKIKKKPMLNINENPVLDTELSDLKLIPISFVVEIIE